VNEVIEMEGNCYEKSVPAHLYITPVVSHKQRWTLTLSIVNWRRSSVDLSWQHSRRSTWRGEKAQFSVWDKVPATMWHYLLRCPTQGQAEASRHRISIGAKNKLELFSRFARAPTSDSSGLRTI